MELAKVASNGQITIPTSIRNKLNVKEGDKIVFIEKPEGIFMINSTKIALDKISIAFEGEAQRLGLENDNDVVEMIKQVRKERYHANNG